MTTTAPLELRLTARDRRILELALLGWPDELIAPHVHFCMRQTVNERIRYIRRRWYALSGSEVPVTRGRWLAPLAIALTCGRVRIVEVPNYREEVLE